MRGLLIKDETFEREAAKPSKLQGLDAQHVLTDVTFENLTIAGQKRTSVQDARIEVSRHVGPVSFR